MLSKWKIKGIDLYVFGEDGNLYKLPFTKNNRSYGVRLIKKQYPNRWRINDTWYSQRQLKDKLYIDKNPVLLFESNDTPF